MQPRSDLANNKHQVYLTNPWRACYHVAPASAAQQRRQHKTIARPWPSSIAPPVVCVIIKLGVVLLLHLLFCVPRALLKDDGSDWWPHVY